MYGETCQDYFRGRPRKCRRFVRAGLGIAQHSMWHIADDLRAGRMERVLPEYEVPDSGIYSVKPQRLHVPPRVRAFEEFLANRWTALAGFDTQGDRSSARSRKSR